MIIYTLKLSFTFFLEKLFLKIDKVGGEKSLYVHIAKYFSLSVYLYVWDIWAVDILYLILQLLDLHFELFKIYSINVISDIVFCILYSRN